MRLLIVSQYFWPETFRVNDLVAELDRRGHSVTVLTGVPNYPDGVVPQAFALAPERFRTFGGAHVVRVPMCARGKGGFRLILNYASFALSGATVGAWKLRGRAFDSVFVFQPSPVTACLPAIVCGRLANAPVILWVLDLWPDTLSAVGAIRSPAVLAAVGVLVRSIYRRCALVLGQSRSFSDNIARYSGDPSRFRYFPSWAEPIFSGDLTAVAPAPEAARFFGSGFNVLFAGNIGDAQDFPTILDAAELLREHAEVRWIIVGDGRAAATLAQEIDRRGLKNSVFLFGRHPIERMPSFFRVADALLVTLRSDPIFAMTIPGKLQAYLAAGVPVIGALDGEGARVIEEADAGAVGPAGDAARLARNVLALAAQTPAARKAMGDRARDYCMREFDRARLVDQLVSLMQECARLRRAVA